MNERAIDSAQDDVSYSITSSARASSNDGTVRPNILAVWASMTNLLRLHHRQVSWHGALQGAARIDAGLTKRIRKRGSTHTGFDRSFSGRAATGVLLARCWTRMSAS